MTIDYIPDDLWEQAAKAAHKQFPRSELDQAFFTSNYIVGFMIEKINEIIDEVNNREA